MIRVLQRVSEIKTATEFLHQRGLLNHTDTRKNWDFENIFKMLEQIPKKAFIVDLGCGPSRYGCVTLNALAKAGYSKLLGIDLHKPWYSVFFFWWAFLRNGLFFRRYAVKKGNLCATGLPDTSVDVALLLSVVEHGVPLNGLLDELASILTRGGVVYLSTDYWPTHSGGSVEMATGSRFGERLPWRIFNETEMREMVDLASRHGLVLKEKGKTDWPTAQEKCVTWRGYEYTFLSFVFVKAG